MNRIFEKIKNKNLIDGKFVEFSCKHLDVINPSKLEVTGAIPYIEKSDIEKAVESASNAFKTWSVMLPKKRAELLYRWQNLIIENADDLAEILTKEHGKPLEEAKKEILYGATFIGWFAAKALDISGSISAGVKDNQKIITEYEAVGVVGAITPWNFPSAMITRKIAPALAAGCTIVLKPSEFTPFSGLAVGLLAQEAGFPDGVINIVTAEADLVSDVFAESKLVRKLSFTGSTRVGKLLYSKSASTLKRISLELGGNAPFIICEDADLEKTANDLLNGKLRGTGQACISPNRVFIHESIYDKIISLLEDKFKTLVVGNGFNPKVNIGPLINQNATAKIDRLIKDAVSKGAKIIKGGHISTEYFDENNVKQKTLPDHTFFEPTIIKDCNPKMDIFKEEIFGPVIACYKFADYDEVINLANDTDYGLASYVYTQNHSLGWKLSDKLDFGIVGINESTTSNEIGAFGGRKESGFGVEGSNLGIYEYLNTKYKCVNY